MVEDPRFAIIRPNDMFWGICSAASKIMKPKELFGDRCILALDPGETTGIANWKEGQILLTQWDTGPTILGKSYKRLERFVMDNGVDHLRYEDYKVYAWKADDHKWASLHTAQWIGGIRIFCEIQGLAHSKKMAQQAKAFWTDDKLKLCGLYEPGMKHARDALRHLLYYMCFPDKGDD
jgi:hypothetical protein